MALLEIACFTKESALRAAKAGADRIELCDDYASGGLSPDPELLRALKSEITIPVFVMIRPHARDFYYSDPEFQAMKDKLVNHRDAGADGFVFGILAPAGPHKPQTPIGIDIVRNKELVQLANGKPCTFHRAFDSLPESLWSTSLRDIARCGFRYILTSGGPSEKDAIDCVDKLSMTLPHQLDAVKKKHLPEGQTLDIIVGGGVRSANLRLLMQRIKAQVYHSSALVTSDGVASIDEIHKMLEIIRERG